MYDYPKIHYNAKHQAYLFLEECQKVLERDNYFFETHVSLNYVSKMCFGRVYFLYELYRKNKLSHFTVIRHYGNLFIPYKEFEDFYRNICNGKPLLSLAKVRSHLDFDSFGKANSFLEYSGFFDLPYFSFSGLNRKFYAHNVVNDFLKLHSVPLVKC